MVIGGILVLGFVVIYLKVDKIDKDLDILTRATSYTWNQVAREKEEDERIKKELRKIEEQEEIEKIRKGIKEG